MGDKNTKICLSSLLIRGMKIKTIMGYHYVAIRISEIKKTDHTNVGEECIKQSNPTRKQFSSFFKG